MPFPDDNSFPDSDVMPDGTIPPNGRPLPGFAANYEIFKEILKKDFIKDRFKEKSTATEIEASLDFFGQRYWQEMYTSRKANSSDWKYTLEMWINKIETDLVNARYIFDLEAGMNMIVKVVYTDRSLGEDLWLLAYVGHIFTDYFEFLRRCGLSLPPVEQIVNDEIFIGRFKNGVELIAKGVGLARHLPQWREELEWLKEKKENLNGEEENKISIAELDSIPPKILLLRELGVIKLLKDKLPNNSKVADFLGHIMKEIPGSIRGFVSNVEGIKNNNSNPESIKSLEKAIIILNDLGCASEVIKLQNKLSKLI